MTDQTNGSSPIRLAAVATAVPAVKTLAALREIDPRLPVLFCSGYSRDLVDVNESQVLGFVKKPYRLSHLAQQVADALARHRDATGAS